MKKGRIFPYFWVFSLLWTTGCVMIQGTTGEPFSPEAVQSIQDGKTTKQEVVGRLGSPSVIFPLDRGRKKYVYHFSKAEGSGVFGFTLRDDAQFLEVVFAGDVVESHQHVIPPGGRR